MKLISCITFAVSILINPLCGIAQYTSPNTNPMNYPITKKVDVSDTYFGTTIKDPYRWLEDDRSAETKAWVESQNKVTQGYLSQIPYRQSIKTRLETLWNYEKYSAPFKEGDYTYFYKNNGLQNQFVLYRQKANKEPEVFWIQTPSQKMQVLLWQA